MTFKVMGYLIKLLNRMINVWLTVIGCSQQNFDISYKIKSQIKKYIGSRHIADTCMVKKVSGTLWHTVRGGLLFENKQLK
jgi:hypothetical protein